MLLHDEANRSCLSKAFNEGSLLVVVRGARRSHRHGLDAKHRHSIPETVMQGAA